MGMRGWLGTGVVLLALAGCGGSTSTPTPTAAPATPPGLAVGPAKDFGDACRLLTPAEVESATSVGPLTTASAKDPQLGSTCTYNPAAGGSSVPVLTVQAVVEYSAASARSMVDQSGGPAIGGLGDDARAAKPGGLGAAVYLAKGADYVVLSSIHKGVTQSALGKLAGTLAGRL
jgi:hypothetical protein